MTQPERPVAAWRTLLPAGLGELALLSALAWWPVARGTWTSLLLFGLAFGLYALAASRVLDGAGGGVLVWVLAVAMRLVLLPATPFLSDDVYRHLWDGRVQLYGINPFLYPPSHAALAHLHTPWFDLIPHPGLLTPYPPVTQLAFFAIAAAGGAILQAKLLWLGFDLGTGWLLGRVAAFTGRSRRLTQLLWLWSPLLLVEVAWNAHAVTLGTFCLVLVILVARAPGSAGAAGALAAFTVPPTLAALPALTRRLGRRYLGGFVLVAAAFCLPFVRGWRHLFAGMLGHLGADDQMVGPFRLIESVVPAGTASVVAAAALFLGVAIWVASRNFRPERALFWILGAALLLAPALRPWLVLWMLPLAALRVSKPWLLMTGVAFAGYLEIRPRPDVATAGEAVLSRLMVWMPVLIWLGVEAARMWRERFPPPLSAPSGATPP